MFTLLAIQAALRPRALQKILLELAPPRSLDDGRKRLVPEVAEVKVIPTAARPDPFVRVYHYAGKGRSAKWLMRHGLIPSPALDIGLAGSHWLLELQRISWSRSVPTCAFLAFLVYMFPVEELVQEVLVATLVEPLGLVTIWTFEARQSVVYLLKFLRLEVPKG